MKMATNGGDSGFSIKGRGLKLDTAEDTRQALHALDSVDHLKYLELEGNTLGVEAAKEVGKYLEKHPELELALWKDLFTGRLNAEIPKALGYLFGGVELAGARLQRLELSDNAIGPVAVVGLVPFFKTHSSFSLKELILNNNGLGPDGGSTFADALINCYKLSQESAGAELFQLRVFECGRNRLEDKASTRLAAFFSDIGSLEEVRMPQNGIRPDGIRELSMGFRQNPNLRVISLNDNCVRADGAGYLAQSLREMNNLQELNLGDCLLTNEGAMKIVQAVKEGSHALRNIILESNEIDGQTAVGVANYLKTFDTLKEVHLSANDIRGRYAEEITTMLTFGKNYVKVFIENDDEESDDGGNEDVRPQQLASAETAANDSWFSNSSLSFPAFSAHSQTQQQPLTTLNPTPSFFLPTVNGGTVDPKIETFLQKPTIDAFRTLHPNPWKLFTDYFRKKGDEQFPYFCVSTAIKLSNLTDTTTQDCFDHLMMEVIRSQGANVLATVLCINYGFIRPEEKDYPQAKPTESTIFALSRFVELSPIPVLVLQCIKEFFGPSTVIDRPGWNSPSNGNLIRAVDKRLSIVPSNLLTSIQ